jgi:crossover junction endodeoxyribonuclease RusA
MTIHSHPPATSCPGIVARSMPQPHDHGAAVHDGGQAGETAAPAGREGVTPAPGIISVTLPWPEPVLSPNAKVNRYVRRSAVRAYRKACAEAAWVRGITPASGATQLVAVTFHPPRGGHDRDNCIARFKAGQDGLADAMGANDRGFAPAYTMGATVKGGAVVALIDIPG